MPEKLPPRYKTLEEAIEHYWEFADKAFDTPAFNSLEGLNREVNELRFEMDLGNTEDELIEFADVFFYFIYALKRSGYTVEQLKFAMRSKLHIIKQRKWNKNPDGTYSHIKD